MRTRTCDMVWWTIQRVRVEFQLSSHWLLVRFGRAYRLPEPLLRLLIEAQVRFVQYVGTYSRKSSSSICSRSLSSFPPSRYSARSSFLSVRPTEGPAEFVVREGRPVRLYRRRGWGRVLGPARGAIGGGLRRASTPVQRRCHLGVHVGQLFAHFPHRERDFLGFLARLRTNLALVSLPNAASLRSSWMSKSRFEIFANLHVHVLYKILWMPLLHRRRHNSRCTSGGVTSVCDRTTAATSSKSCAPLMTSKST